MRNPSEAFFKALNKHMESLDSLPEDAEGMDKVLQDFMEEYRERLAQRGPLTEKTAQTADDFLELAETASSKAKKVKYLKKACELDEGNIDAGMHLATLTAKSEPEFARRVEELLAQARKQLEAGGFFAKENIGEFWLITETRPFMRAYEAYMNCLIADGKIRQAIDAGLDMLRLCHNDNLGIRYVLMNCYAALEDEAGAVTLHERYGQEATTMFCLPLSLLCYRLGKEEKATQYLKQLREVNSDTKRFFSLLLSDCRPNVRISPYGYRSGTMEEFVECLNLRPETYMICQSYWSWGMQKIKEMAKGEKRPAKAIPPRKK